jgi:hypothetical protein
MKKLLSLSVVLGFTVSSTGLMAQNTFPGSGNVGIGTTSPNAPLEVRRNGYPFIRISGYGGQNAVAGLELCPNDPQNLYLPSTRIIATDDGNYGAVMQIQSKVPGAIGNNLLSRLTITNQGNVGIGTDEPHTKLLVNGDMSVGGYNDNMGQLNKLYFNIGRDFAGSNSDPMWIGQFNAAGDASELRVNLGDGVDFNDRLVIGSTYHIDGKWYPGMTVTNSGVVGIGTQKINEAGYRLFVESGIRTRKVKVDQDTWADYVFHANYRLRPLSEVEAYIQQNHHLPEVPSEEEVKKDGIDLGNNQATLLKKVEELTLYLIDQNKKLQDVEKEMKEMKKENLQLKQQVKQLAAQKAGK